MTAPSNTPISWRERKATLEGRRHILWLLLGGWLVVSHITDWLNYYLGRWSLVDLLDKIAKLSILIVALTWLAETETRKKQELRDLWRTVYQTRGIAQIDALKELQQRHHESFFGLKMSYADLSHFDFTGTDLRNCDFTGCNLTGAVFKDAKLCNANFKSAVLIDADFSNATLNGASFEDAILQGSRFYRASVTHANFQRATMNRVQMYHSWFSGADMREAVLIGAGMNRRTYLLQARLEGADFREVTGLTTEKIENAASWDEASIFPDGFREKLSKPIRAWEEPPNEWKLRIRIDSIKCNRPDEAQP